LHTDQFTLHVEAIVFCALEPISILEIQSGLEDHFQTTIGPDLISSAILALQDKYRNDMYPFEVLSSGGGFQFLTKPAFQPSVGAILKQKIKKRLSTSAMETLAIIAYKQPVSKPDLEKIRGVNCDYAIQKLLDKELVEIAGKAESAGRPTLYRTSKKFMDYFGINHLNQLPDLKELESEDNSIGLHQET